MQLCSCLATAAEGKHEQLAAIPTLVLVLEARHANAIFFLLSKSDSFQHFFKAATKPLSWLEGPEKCKSYQAAVYLKALLPQRAEPSDKDPFRGSFSHTKTKERT